MSALVLFCTLPLLATIASVPWLVVVLISFGASLGSIDVAINIQAIAVEHRSGRAMMSGFHGFFSVGGVVGALSATALLSAGVAPIWATVAVVLVLFFALLSVIAHLLADRSERTDSMFALPHGIVLLLGVLALIVFLSEGAVLDWSGVFLTSARDVSPSYAGLGYAAFAFTMTLGRLTGDRIVQALGAVKVVGLGGLLAALGFLIATYASPWILALVGYALVGAGCSNIVPVLMTSAGRQTVMSKNLAVSAVTTLGYLGILAGPACIGFIAHFLGLPTAFLMLAILLLGVAVSSRFLSLNR
jgi:predicted MFS family arabinose efflux permease